MVSRNAPEFLGIFPPYRAGALAGVSGNRIGQWARYGLIRASYFEGRPANLYAFYDVSEAIVVHWLRDRGFGYGEIHSAVSAARKDHPEWPLVKGRLGVAKHAVHGDPRGAIVQEVDKDVYVETGRAGGQVMLRPQLLDAARDVLRRGGWIADQLRLKRIEVDPQKLGGAPTIKGHRWPVERIAQLAADEKGRAILEADYRLKRPEIDESLIWVKAAAALYGRTAGLWPSLFSTSSSPTLA
jgi:uncharacterized protein (DUF433 family)